jgi:hypothetical protein
MLYEMSTGEVVDLMQISYVSNVESSTVMGYTGGIKKSQYEVFFKEGESFKVTVSVNVTSESEPYKEAMKSRKLLLDHLKEIRTFLN